MKLYLFENFDKKLLPVPASQHREWWPDNDKTRAHARYCLPLLMANSIGYYILSPASFKVEWNGNTSTSAVVTVFDKATHGDVDNHAAYGSFTVQPGFVPMTEQVGEFLFVKGIPNERGLPYSCMEAVIEAWWNPASFGLVFLLNQAGTFIIQMGQPIAQMFSFAPGNGLRTLELLDSAPDEFVAWERKRNRPDYVRDLDYLRGVHPDGRPEPGHMKRWP